MPQPRRSGQAKRGGASGGAKRSGSSGRAAASKGGGSAASKGGSAASKGRSTTAKGKAASRPKSGAAKPSAKRTTTRASGAAAKGKSTQRTKAGARKGTASKGRAAAKGRRTPKAASPRGREGDISAKTVAELREALSSRMIDPLGLVMLTRERIEEALDDAVTRGRVTADDAQDLVGGILERGRKQTNDVLADLEQLLSRGRDELGGRAEGARKRGSAAARAARTRVEEATSRARKEAAKHGDPVMAKVDQARRAGGIGPSFPISGYDDLTVAQVQGRLGGLSRAELRKVRDYERRHANRKTVLAAIAETLD